MKQTSSCIEADQHDYVSEVQPVMIERKSIQETKDSLNADEKQQFRGLIGQLNWLSGQTRPDIACESCKASVAFKEAKVSDVLKANKAVRKLKCDDVSLTFLNLGDLKRCKIK